MYCKNCGSILASNANFCHVCGAKVEIDDIFDAPKKEDKNEFSPSFEEPKEEVKTENSSSYGYYRPNQEEPKSQGYYRPNQEEPKSQGYYRPNEEEPKSQGYGYYGYQPSSEEQKEYQERTARKRAFIPGLIGVIGTGVISIEAGFSYLVSILSYNEAYNTGYLSGSDYQSSVSNLLISTAVYLILGLILGAVLGSLSLVLSNRAKSKKGIIFGSIAIGLASLDLLLCILCFVYKGMLGL